VKKNRKEMKATTVNPIPLIPVLLSGAGEAQGNR
jgi:hypothetical protein